MPIPLLIWAAVVIAAGVAGAGGVAIWRALKSKKIVLLGEQAVGKTSLCTYLTEGSIPQKYEPSLFAKDVKGDRIKIRDIGLDIESVKDLPGSDDDYGTWEQAVHHADIILYLVRIDHIMKEDKSTERRVEQDMLQIRKWLQECDSKKFPLFIVGTHCDCTDEDFTKLSLPERAKYKSKVRKMPILSRLVSIAKGAKHVRFVPGSLKNLKTSEQLAYDLFGEISAIIETE